MLNKGIRIWEEKEVKSQAVLETFLLEGEEKRPAVLICPGGGYEFVSDREGKPVAKKFNSAGFHAGVLNYSTAPKRHPQPLRDLSRAVCLLREKAEEWKIKRDKIVVCGFSAGGHLAASLGVHWDKPYLEVPGIELDNNKPNGLILGYPVISADEFGHRESVINLLGPTAEKSLWEEMSLEKQVREEMAPTFLWHTLADEVVPVENSLLLAQEMRKQEVAFELHIFPEGPHGLSLATKETDEGRGTYPHTASWMNLCLEWLEGLFKKEKV